MIRLSGPGVRFVVLVLALCPGVVLADACADLRQFARTGVTIDRAEVERTGSIAVQNAQGAKQSLNVPAFCRVAATLRPSADSDIKIEVWLPEQWNTKLVAVGNGGWNGAIQTASMVPMLERGYAVTGTDTGHAGSSMDGSFAYKHPEKLRDFGWRAVHEMTLTAKAIVDAYYTPALTRSYWNGCSSGGKQGLKEAQMFPEDYDGIVAGAPAVPWTHLSAASLAVGRATLPVDSPRYLSREKLKLLNDAVLKACDTLDQVQDGLIEDPRACTFEPKSLQCSAESSTTCLTAPQVSAANQIYGALRNPRTNEYTYAGFSKGSELAWGLLAGGPRPLGIANDHFRFVVFENPDWNFMTMDFDKDVTRADEIDAKGAQLNAAHPDLDAFRRRGAKLLMYHGWADGLIPAQNSIDYFEAVLTRDDKQRKPDALIRLQKDVRLFMAPGVGHCGGGTGPDRFDALSALEQWVEHGRAPDMILAEGRARDGAKTTHPLCAYPQVATHSSGNTTEAGSFVCK
jgi:feruloyl esterase